MLASSWKIVYYFVRNIRSAGVTDSGIRTQLLSNGWLRIKYLALYDIVDNLTSLYRARLSLLATTSRKFESLGCGPLDPTFSRFRILMRSLYQLILQDTSRKTPIMRKEGRNMSSSGLSSKHCKSHSLTQLSLNFVFPTHASLTTFCIFCSVMQSTKRVRKSKVSSLKLFGTP